MQINDSLSWATQKLNLVKTNSAALDAEVLLSHTLNKPKSFLYTYPEKKLTKTQLAKFKKYISRRAKQEPVAYITNHKEFYSLDFFVNKNVLIPRPETEILIEQVLKNKRIKTIADIGTGSGCIAIALAKNNPKLKIYATDISSKVLQVARKNAKSHKVKNIIFKKGNLLEPIKNIKLDAIVANLPYLDTNLKQDILDSTEIKTLKFEPPNALYAGHDGLNLYRKLFKQIKKLKYQPKNIYCEIGHHQYLPLKKFVTKLLPSAKISLKKDYAGLNRIFMLYLAKYKNKQK